MTTNTSNENSEVINILIFKIKKLYEKQEIRKDMIIKRSHNFIPNSPFKNNGLNS